MAGQRKGSFQATKNRVIIFWHSITPRGKHNHEFVRGVDSYKTKSQEGAQKLILRRNTENMARVIYYNNQGISQTLIQ